MMGGYTMPGTGQDAGFGPPSLGRRMRRTLRRLEARLETIPVWVHLLLLLVVLGLALFAAR